MIAPIFLCWRYDFLRKLATSAKWVALYSSDFETRLWLWSQKTTFKERWYVYVCVMDRDGWSGMFHECSFNNKCAFAITYIPLIVYNNNNAIVSKRDEKTELKEAAACNIIKYSTLAICSVIIIHDNNYTFTDATETPRLHGSLNKVARTFALR